MLSFPPEGTPEVNVCCDTRSGCTRRGAAPRLERDARCFPTRHDREFARRRHETDRVRRYDVRLDYILRIFLLRLTPAADFHVHFPGWSKIVPGEQGEHGRWRKMRNVAHHEPV